MWQIVPVHPPSHTYQSFFVSEVMGKCSSNIELDQVHVGKTKNGLDLVDKSLIIVDVCSLFGNFVKFTVDTPPIDAPTVEHPVEVQGLEPTY